MNKILVTGGNIGNHVAEDLARRGASVRVLVREAVRNTTWERLGIEQIAEDFSKGNSLLPVLEGVEKFFSLSPFTENFVEFGAKSVEAARQAGVRLIVRSSVMGAGENSVTIGRLHYEVEKAVETSGLAYAILQPNAFMQNFLLSAESVKARGAFYQPLGDGKVSYVDVRDIAAVAAAVLSEPRHQGKRYVLTGPEALSNSDVARKLSLALNKKVEYVNVTSEQAEDSMRKMGMPEWMIPMYSELFAECKADRAASVSPDVTQILKKNPLGFDEFVRDHLQAFSEASAGAVPT